MFFVCMCVALSLRPPFVSCLHRPHAAAAAAADGMATIGEELSDDEGGGGGLRPTGAYRSTGDGSGRQYQDEQDVDSLRGSL